MARFDVYRRPERASGYLVDLQADILSRLGTRLVAPLVAGTMTAAGYRYLNPVLDVLGKPHIMITQGLFTIPLKRMGRPVCSLKQQSDDMLRAIDVLLNGI